MKVSAVIKFSWKNLLAHKMRMLLTVGGVAIGIAAIVFLVSLGFGLERLVTTQVADFRAFTILDVPSTSQRAGDINDVTIDKVLAIPHVTGVERITDLAGRVRLQSQDSTTETVVIGADPAYHDLAGTSLTLGKLYETEADSGIILNESLVNLLGYDGREEELVGQQLLLDLIVPKSLRADDDVDGAIVKEGLPVTVTGVTGESDSPLLYVPSKLLAGQGLVNSTSMKITIDDKENVPAARNQIENLGFYTEYVGDTVDQITQVFGMFRIVLGAFGAIALFVAAIGAFNTLTISLMERMREVALLKMLGMKRKDVFKLFIAESITIGVIGGVLGAGFGLGIGAALNALVRQLAQRANVDVVSIVSAPLDFVALIVASSVLVGFLTGFYPSYRAIKTNPLEALRYE